ncbi:PH domain-containing protein [Haloterrigena alkaliphila]|uniref:PH domain-containing protein n=1 Tax=Haloterrigena alkaliphila TaxID=2816475 RepID=UPI001CED1FFB|nr:PH domain-containing protein [Haloterrigena alkaliphila]QSX01177.2 PH domain-containing protein [Haloterrigena alkaliphila]
MTSHERRPTLEIGEPDIGFQAGFGFYLGLVAAGVATIVGLLADVGTATLLGVLPSTVTVVAIVGHIYARGARGLPERIGRSRWRRLGCYAPAGAFTAVLLTAGITPVEATGRFVVLTVAAAVLAGVSGFGLDRMAKNRYVDALTADEPAATWTWQRSGGWNGEPAYAVIMAVMILAGVVSVWQGEWYLGPFWIVYGVVMILSRRYGWYDLDETDHWNPPEIRAHEAGLVVDRSFWNEFVPWETIDGVRLTDDELVVERRRFGLDSSLFDLRCDRSAIDDAEAVLEALERARGRADRRDSRAVEAAD